MNGTSTRIATAARVWPIGTTVRVKTGYGLGGVRRADCGSVGMVRGYTRLGWLKVQWVHDAEGELRNVDPSQLRTVTEAR